MNKKIINNNLPFFMEYFKNNSYKTNEKYIFEHYFFNSSYRGIENYPFLLNNSEIVQFGKAKLNASIEVLSFKEFTLLTNLFNKHLELNSFTHKQWSVLFSLKDDQLLSINCEQLKKNNIIIIPPYTHISTVLLGKISQLCRIAINSEYLRKITNGEFDLKNKQIKILYIDSINNLRENMFSIFQKAHTLKNGVNSIDTKILIKNDAYEIVQNVIKILKNTQNLNSKMMSQDLFHATSFLRFFRNEKFNINKITEHLGINDRTLRYKFMNNLNVSPKRYHTSLRLHEVMKALTKGNDKTIISDIANTWGFWHMGQFAKDYKEYYGELPSETLKKKDTISSRHIKL